MAQNGTDMRFVQRQPPSTPMATPTRDAGWTRLEDVPDGYPDVHLVSPEPLAEGIDEMNRTAAALEEMDPDDSKAKVLRFAAERMRRRLWKACDLPRELPPKGIAALPGIDVTAGAVRYWCKTDKVQYRRTKSGRYLVDVDSALEHAGLQ